MENSLATIPTDGASEAGILEKSRQAAVVNLLFAQEEIARRIIDPTTTTKALLDMAEHSYKVSGMAAKQAEKPTGPGFSITIQLPGEHGGAPTVIEMVQAKDVQPVDPFPDLPAPPAYLLADKVGNLTSE